MPTSWKRRRDNLMAADPHCFYCRTEVVYYPLERHERMPDNFATIDHVNTRLAYPEGRPLNGDTVLACHRCNSDRNKVELRLMPKEELWRRSGRMPVELRGAS